MRTTKVRTESALFEQNGWRMGVSIGVVNTVVEDEADGIS